MKRFCVPVLILITSLSCPGTAAAQPAYPQGYFRNPLDIPILLAGNFGECRPGHFHSGVDIKTGGKENLPVFAAADGYISRIKMEPGGFGHGLYITHPNGYTTLYAHLNQFIPAVQQYVRQQQYAAERWTVDLTLNPGQFPVRQGDLIAFSGNTGGSTAPHLHFEIRDTRTEHPLNPQLFGLAIKDTRPPVPTRLAIYNRDQPIYNDTPAILKLLPKGSYYTTADTVLVNDNTGFGLEVNDYMNGSDNTLAFYTAEWYVDEVLQGRIRLNDIGYDETRYLHAYADYKTRQLRNTWIQCLFRLPGNGLGHIYEDLNPDNGHIIMPDNEVHNTAVKLTDDAGNITWIRFRIRRGRAAYAAPCTELWQAAKQTAHSSTNLAYSFDNKTIYEDACIVAHDYREDAGSFSDRHQVGMSYIPAHHAFEVRIRPNRPVPFDLRNKIAMMYSDGRSESGCAATQQDKGWYKASVRNFGDYWLVADTTAPVIQPLVPWKEDQRRTRRITFRVTDDKTSVKSFRGELDGQWILFEQHEQYWFYEPDSHCPPGKHNLSLTATDENGNIARRVLLFTR